MKTILALCIALGGLVAFNTTSANAETVIVKKSHRTAHHRYHRPHRHHTKHVTVIRRD